jgi:hypothetical protein
MSKVKTKRTSYIRLRLTPQERQIIELINAHDYTNVSEHVRRSLHFYAVQNYPTIIASKSMN